jgi:hypothetical protein
LHLVVTNFPSPRPSQNWWVFAIGRLNRRLNVLRDRKLGRAAGSETDKAKDHAFLERTVT